MKHSIRFDIISAFPEAFESYFDSSIIKRARKNGIVRINVYNLRQWAEGKHKTIDDRPYGGGPGMILKIEPIYKAVKFLKSRIKNKKSPKPYVILFSAKGKILTQETVRAFSKRKWFILICGHYEGVDERVARYIADEEISIGEYVLTGGELPAMVFVDAISRLIPGVLGKAKSFEEESFSKPGYREYPQYTRPEVFVIREKGKVKKLRVPKILLSGNHKKIEQWRKEHSFCK
jgi:tRNA (guanine37-N1)-methyltransferase